MHEIAVDAKDIEKDVRGVVGRSSLDLGIWLLGRRGVHRRLESRGGPRVPAGVGEDLGSFEDRWIWVWETWSRRPGGRLVGLSSWRSV